MSSFQTDNNPPNGVENNESTGRGNDQSNDEADSDVFSLLNNLKVSSSTSEIEPENRQNLSYNSAQSSFDTSKASKSPRGSPNESPRLSPTISVTQDSSLWQNSKRNIRERSSVMFNNTLMSDVSFLVGPQEVKIPAHKYILATGSSVFFAMFYGGLADESSTDLVISVTDADPGAFLIMLNYLYSDVLSLNSDNALSTLYIAKKYIIPHLVKECVKYLETILTAKNACVLLSQARLFDEPELSSRCWEAVDAQASSALDTESFADIDFDTLLVILSRETLNCSELSVFKAAISWAKARLNESPNDKNELGERIREILGPALLLIRFPAMSVSIFADEVVNTGILSLQEITELFLYFTSTKSKPEIAYNPKPRVGLPVLSCRRFLSSAYRSNQWIYRGRCDSIQFSVDRRIFVVGYGLYGSSTGSSEYSAKIELKGPKNACLASTSVKFHSDGSSNAFVVTFEEPVQIEPEHFYTASVVLDGDELSYFGQEGLSEKNTSGVNFQFQCSSESTNGTGVQGGQIPEILFYGPS